MAEQEDNKEKVENLNNSKLKELKEELDKLVELVSQNPHAKEALDKQKQELKKRETEKTK